MHDAIGKKWTATKSRNIQSIIKRNNHFKSPRIQPTRDNQSQKIVS